MKSVGETMAIGRTFKEALQKGLRGLDIGHSGLDNKLNYQEIPEEKIRTRLRGAQCLAYFISNTLYKKEWLSKRRHS